MIDERSYLLQRFIEECVAVEMAKCPEARNAHRLLARELQRRLNSTTDIKVLTLKPL